MIESLPKSMSQRAQFFRKCSASCAFLKSLKHSVTCFWGSQALQFKWEWQLTQSVCCPRKGVETYRYPGKLLPMTPEVRWTNSSDDINSSKEYDPPGRGPETIRFRGPGLRITLRQSEKRVWIPPFPHSIGADDYAKHPLADRLVCWTSII